MADLGSGPRGGVISLLVAMGLAASQAASAGAVYAEEACGLASHADSVDRHVADYSPVFLACSRGSERRLATRSMGIDNVPTLLLVDPMRLSSSLERRECWSCTPTSDAEESGSTLVMDVRRAAEATGERDGSARINAGLQTVAGGGTYVTADLCPSRRPLDREVIDKLASRQPDAPIGLSVSGAWLRQHHADLDWLRGREAAGAIAVTWINHTDRHRFVQGLSADANFMLLPRTDVQAEILGEERQLVQSGETPSVFFRFPGLISTPSLDNVVAADHLITIGARTWLATGRKPKPGDVVLLHANGNEEVGVRALSRLLDAPASILPLKSVTEAR